MPPARPPTTVPACSATSLHHRGHLPAGPGAVLAQLVAGAEQLGATGVTVTDDGALAPIEDAAADDDAEETVLLTRELEVPEGGTTFTARVSGPADEVARRVEALDLLVAQARVGLANAVLVHELELLKQTYQDQATRTSSPDC